MSSGESEWYAAVRTASSHIGFVNMAADLGRVLRPRLLLDATAAKGIASRRGAGKIRHIDVQTLWLQRLVTEKLMDIEKVDGKTGNPSNLGTKHVDRADLVRELGLMSFFERSGRSKLALRATFA